ncbi:MAG: sodium-dependent transporter [Candidatus Latescibacteria bacterium]|nr:sodium-dependent transporter [Candidatus Latescibacterota bacterium]
MASAIGIAIGTGNIWRFPRIAATNGGGVFIFLWMVFLFLWSIPLLFAESSLGRITRRGTLDSFALLMGKRGIWMGGFVALSTTGIMCYYSVVTGWCLKYLTASIMGTVNARIGPDYWYAFAGSAEAEAFHLASAILAGTIVFLGIRVGIEYTSRLFVPILGVILLYSAIRALILPGALNGVRYLFHFDPSDFAHPRVYLEALSQSAWSTGAGWGLLLTYSIYSRSKEPIVGNSLIMAIVNNMASILAALAIIPTVFAVFPVEEAQQVVQATGESNTGFCFIWIPTLLGGDKGGQYMLVFFFLALTLAAITSLIAMIEMVVRNLIDLGLNRTKATIAVTFFIALCGSPSALNSAFFDNQDWVWGLGLLINGLFFTFVVRHYGVRRFREQVINIPDSKDIKLGIIFEPLILWIIPIQFVLLIGWWFYQSLTWDPINWWNPASTFSIGTCLFQWGFAAVLVIILGSYLDSKLKKSTE